MSSGSASEGVQDFGKRRVHARAFASRQNNHGQRGRRRAHSSLLGITVGKREPKLMDFLAQRIAINAEDRGGFDLIAAALM